MGCTAAPQALAMTQPATTTAVVVGHARRGHEFIAHDRGPSGRSTLAALRRGARRGDCQIDNTLRQNRNPAHDQFGPLLRSHNDGAALKAVGKLPATHVRGQRIWGSLTATKAGRTSNGLHTH